MADRPNKTEVRALAVGLRQRTSSAVYWMDQGDDAEAAKLGGEVAVMAAELSKMLTARRGG